jgi:glycosyltransferase involved in cell wall biosynthesis
MFQLLDKERIKPVLVTPHETDFVKMLRRIGSRCIVIPPPRPLSAFGGEIMRRNVVGKLITGIALIVHMIKLISVIKTEKADIVQCHSIRSLITIGWAAKFLRKPCCLYIKGELSNPILDRIAFRIADKIMFLCERLRDLKYPQLVKRYSQKIGILKLGVDLEKIEQIEKTERKKLRIELNVSHDEINIVFIGSVIPQKGVMYLIEAFDMVKKSIPKVKLYIVGDHCNKEYEIFLSELKQFVVDKGIVDHVVFTGWRMDAINILSLMDILVLPSLTEGFGRCIVEAMTLGKPVVATMVGGIPDVVRHGETGFLVQAKDAEALADSIIRLAEDEHTRVKFGETARRVAFSEYSIKDNIAGMEKVYRELVSTTA